MTDENDKKILRVFNREKGATELMEKKKKEREIKYEAKRSKVEKKVDELPV